MDYDFDEDALLADAERDAMDDLGASMYAAQREEEEEEEDSYTQSSSNSANQLLHDRFERELPQSLPKSAVVRKTLPSHLSAAAKPSFLPVFVKEEKPYEDFFLTHPMLRQKEMTVTLSNGDRKFYAIKDGGAKRRFVDKSMNGGGSLPQRFDQKTFSRLETEANLKFAVQERVSSLANGLSSTARKQVGAVAMNTQSKDEPKVKYFPLVQRHVPTRFVDLLSHEKRNRDALQWLNSVRTRNPNDPNPQPRVLLLSGPPGTGKTTLCHVLARRAGYRVMEINASDERSLASLKDRVANATEMKSLFSDGRENLVVLDEIDGAADGIQSVVQYAMDNSKTRPIVCTCNDPWIPALRPLRRVALVIPIALPARSRLVKRLREICVKEKIHQRAGALERLAARMGDDIRACLNAMDFWVMSKKHHINPLTGLEEAEETVLDVDQVEKLPAFSKDGAAELWTTWKQVLANKVKVAHNGILARHAGDVDTVIDGIHENFMRGKFVDSNFAKTSRACDWLTFADISQTRIYRDQDYSFGAYSEVACLGVGRAVGNGDSSRKIVFPLKAGAFRAESSKNADTVKEFLQGASKATRTFTKRDFTTDVVSPLVNLLVPNVRAVPMSVMAPAEKAELERAVQLSIELGLQWVEHTDYANNGVSTWGLDPAVDRLCSFEHMANTDDGAKQSIAPDLARSLSFRLRRGVPSSEFGQDGFRKVSITTAGGGGEENTDGRAKKKRKTDEHASQTAGKVFTSSAATAVGKSSAPMMSPATTTEIKEIRAPVIKRDFFGRVIIVKPPSDPVAATETQDASAAIEDNGISFRFFEGVTDAVKRAVKMQYL